MILKVNGVEHSTLKAVLFKSDKGDFWIPKSLVEGFRKEDGLLKCYDGFVPKYINSKPVTVSSDDFDDEIVEVCINSDFPDNLSWLLPNHKFKSIKVYRNDT